MTTDGKVYTLFANIFAKEPTVELLHKLQSEGTKKLFNLYKVDPTHDIKHISPEKQKELLDVEYARLFLSPNMLAAPYESLQRGEGRLWSELTIEVNKIYKKFGFALDNNFKDAPDHLSAELSFLAELSKLESEYKDKGLKEARTGVLEVKKHFLNNHLLKWFPTFKDKVDKYAKFAYYREITRLLGIMLERRLSL